MKEVVVKFLKAEVVNYYFENQSFDIRVVYEADCKQKQVVKHITKEDRDMVSLAENILLETRRLEKSLHNVVLPANDPLAAFVNVKIVEEDDVPERLARFVTRVMNQARSNSLASTVPRYQIRDNICKISSSL